MGFTTGFTGGVTLTLSLAYLSVLAHQRTREQQGSALRAQALAIQGLIDPLPPLPPPTRSEVAAAQRAQTVEIAKDRWNTEVENAVRWVQHTDWVQVREGLEDTASRLWARAFGVSPSEAVGEAGRKVAETEQQAKPIVKQGAAKLGDASGKVAAAAKSAFQKAKAESQDFASVVLDHSKDKENVDIAQEDGTLSALTPVERALQQRFSKPEDKVNKTVEEALNDRYKLMDEGTMAGDDSKGGTSNGKSHYSKRQHSSSHAEGHHRKSHHDKSSRPDTGTVATEDLYGMESGAMKKKKRRRRRPKPNPRLPTDFLALLCWDSWLPWPIDSKKTHVDNTSRKHKRSRKRTSHPGTSHRVQSWVQEVSSQVTPSEPPIPSTVPSLAPSTPPSHPVSPSPGPQQGAKAEEAEEAASNNGRTKE
ncbi:uncharacterized protein FTJAE_9630 [Fusarium tjaetaba]|uniref:MICOS complex subunit MIC12 n=1 Tax=Fusarium tjaetaba TaxID=1567544 RepID=A0A8H5VLB0_9HYPO|nr:uncharacterized protein FTJAE_9630 [Fusarium tjaetaba]KAF5626465.1 hypothetical protein FTJAE_9630 [Fusarium tjaetaba]